MRAGRSIVAEGSMSGSEDPWSAVARLGHRPAHRWGPGRSDRGGEAARPTYRADETVINEEMAVALGVGVGHTSTYLTPSTVGQAI